MTKRYPSVATFEITTNRRSQPDIVEVANRLARTIPGRLDKTMTATRSSLGADSEVVVWYADDELEEGGWIAELVLQANDAGVPFRDMAVWHEVRRNVAAHGASPTGYPRIGPRRPGGRSLRGGGQPVPGRGAPAGAA